jgi:hypothetical protein
MGGQTSIWGQNVFDPLGAAIERRTFGAGREAAKNRKKSTNKFNQAEANRAEIYKMMKDRQASVTKQLQNMPTALNAQQDGLKKQQDTQNATQPIEQVAQPIGQVDQNATNAILNPTPAVTPTTVSSVAAPTQAMVSPTAPLANQATGMAQQTTNQFKIPSVIGLRFGGT